MRFLSKFLSHMLIVSMIMLPFSAQSGMMTTDQVLAGTASEANANKVREFLSRADIVRQFEAMGVDAKAAQERVNAMTPGEIDRIAGKIDSLPAGASSARGNTVWWVVAAFIIAVGIWWNYK